MTGLDIFAFIAARDHVKAQLELANLRFDDALKLLKTKVVSQLNIIKEK